MNTKFEVKYLKDNDTRFFYCYATSDAHAMRLCTEAIRKSMPICAVDLRQIPIKVPLRGQFQAATVLIAEEQAELEMDL